MRSTTFGLMLAAAAAMPAVNAEIEYSPNASVFFAYSFDGSQNAQNTGLQYGLQLDHDWRSHFAQDRAPLLRWQFDSLGFDHISVAGTPLLSQEMILRQNEEGGILSFIKNNFGPLAVGISAALVVFTAVDSDSDSGDRDVGDIERDPQANDPQFDCDAEPRSDFCTPPDGGQAGDGGAGGGDAGGGAGGGLPDGGGGLGDVIGDLGL